MAKVNPTKIGNFTSPSDDLVTAVESFLSYCQSKNLSENTLVYYRYRLTAFQRYLSATDSKIPPENLTPHIIRGFVSGETKSKSPSTANHSIITLRAFFNYLVRDGFLQNNPMAVVEKVKRRKTVIESFALDQVERIIAACGKDFTGIRDKAIITVLLDCGLRASELCGLNLADISWSEQTMLVLGKGDKERIVPFGQSARQALTQYLVRRGELDTNS